MPQKLFDANGAEQEVPTPEELKALQDAAEAAKKVPDLEKQLKEKDQEINPNWKQVREQLADKDKQISDLTAKATAAGAKLDTPALTREDAEKIAAEQANQTYINHYKNRVLSSFGDKREVVEKYFEKLSAGEKLDEGKVNELAAAAASAAGIKRSADPMNRAMSAHGTMEPQFRDPNEKKTDYADSEAGKERAAAMGLTQAEVKK